MNVIYSIISKCKLNNNEDSSHFAGNELNFCPVINEDNNMPNLPNKSINGIELDTNRKISSIPRAGYNQNWIYPSVMQFYNALVIKNKLTRSTCDSNVTDINSNINVNNNNNANNINDWTKNNSDEINSNEIKYMNEAVRAHNDVNELSWDKILKWERLHQSECNNPKLRRFVGRYNKMSPKSIFKRIFTRFEKPFDRHDWYIDRCGKEIRYILDYYDDPKSNNYLQIYIDVRPGLDNFSNIYDRIRYPILSFFKFI